MKNYILFCLNYKKSVGYYQIQSCSHLVNAGSKDFTAFVKEDQRMLSDRRIQLQLEHYSNKSLKIHLILIQQYYKSQKKRFKFIHNTENQLQNTNIKNKYVIHVFECMIILNSQILAWNSFQTVTEKGKQICNHSHSLPLRKELS